MIGIVEQHPYIGRGWWWDFNYDSKRYYGYAITKHGSIRAMKRRYKKVVKQRQRTGQRIEVELNGNL